MTLENPTQPQNKESLRFDNVKRILEQTLEKVGNSEDCFWISHAWAESLVSGTMVSKKNFPFSPKMEVRSDAEWRSGAPGYKGIHLSQGVESYIITRRTQGVDGSLPPREYHHLLRFAAAEELIVYIAQQQSGTLNMILLKTINATAGHALLALRFEGSTYFIDNSAEPGAWVKSAAEFAEKDWEKDTFAHVYTYPEKITLNELHT